MNLCAYNLLDRFDNKPNASVRICGQAKMLEAERADILVRVTVPRNVLEWYVDVLHANAIVEHGWCDYEGYDDTPREQLDQRMASDVEAFVASILTRDVRLVEASKSVMEKFASRILKREVRLFAVKQQLEWLVEGSWKPALDL